ncbi:MAG: cytochrome c maturation protein CcmE [Ignavibacteriaceae bacterium]|jgi:Cytochrome c-type biogenesis protein CcmE|nr:MAG: cytochrome c maturation protein CcmE [Chlorobiota bacterium]KXK01821.1 MAG: cytochrome c-type biogenesis protein E [Chlorobi bacterium OLB4]MBV6399334.1 hypothetical protein [Ignavibacteria bacterium]MCC6886779.1 cytochrome c maturation protein CcmE [Ignavibacteriales bacterium]MCE7953716.1 cytochrome c maturation protein CcmE [Chlorobi bacterium CHB7]MDL1887651.1 cytochrome c maturation protein CcmE [Ignavibacteria bacterium CHB1]MEB2329871.1 cytochrome c maturation protein CcmE [Ign
MNKSLIGAIIIIVFLAIGFFSFMDSKIEYVNFADARDIHKKVEVKGQWVKDKESNFDSGTNTFTFWMKDDYNNEMKVILDGGKPNNFEVADAIVVKGKVKDGTFMASEVLTKCPSKYEATGEEIKNSGY